MDVPKELLYTREHEWIRIEGETGTVGITDHAQSALGDITFIELPVAGRELRQFQPMASVESVKAASDIYAPVSGKVAETNEILSASPDMLNKSCYGDGWICRIKIADAGEKANLMDAAAYAGYVKGLDH